MNKKPIFDNQWLENAVADVESSASTVIVVETADPIRESQIQEFCLSNGYGDIFRYHPWTGLESFLSRESKWQPATTSAQSEYDTGLQKEVADLAGALRYMEKTLRSRKVAFVLRGLDRSGPSGIERNTEVINAIRAWTLDPGIMMTKSVIFLVTSKPSSAIDETTLELAILARPPLATEQERHAVACSVVEPLARTSEGHKHTLALATAGLNLHQARTVLMKTYHITRDFSVHTVKHYKSDYIRRSDVVEIEEPNVGFDDVGGYEDVKQMIREDFCRAMQEPERYRKAALALPRGLLLFGPPGTGKTLFAKALAKETNLPFINMKTENLFTRWLGESGQRVRNAIRLAEQAAPALVFIDEIDRFGQRGSSQEDSAAQETQRTFAQMLEWLGDTNRKTCIVGTTNIPGNLDKAFLRAGRFSYRIPFLYPNKTARLQILRMHLGLEGSRQKPEMDEKSVLAVLPSVAAKTQFYAGADIEELVIRGKRAFARGNAPAMTGDDLMHGLKEYQVDTKDRRATLNAYLELGPEYADSKALLEKQNQED